MDFQLRGKVVIITGATANIGRAVALDFAREGSALILGGRDANAGERVVAQALREGASKAIFVQADLLRDAGISRIAEAAQSHFGKVDVLVNNVGGNFDSGFFVDSNPDLWEKDVQISFGTVLGVTHKILPLMIGTGSGRIINLGSTAGTVGDYLLAVYSAAKGAVAAFTRVLAKEVGCHGITVNCVAPYATQSDNCEDYSSGSRFHPEHGFFTKMVGKVPPEELMKMVRTSPLGRSAAKPEEVAAAVLFLASTRASFITGQTLHVDGGTLL